MTISEREIQRKLRTLQYAEKVGDAGKVCRYFEIGKTSFYRRRKLALHCRNVTTNLIGVQWKFAPQLHRADLFAIQSSF